MIRHLSFILPLLLFYRPLSAQSWQKMETRGEVPATEHASAALNTRTGHVLLFGGITDKGNSNELWHFDTHTHVWSKFPVKGNNSPKGRFTHVCMFDSVANQLLLFSGQGEELYNDVWAFQLADSAWHELFKDGNVPDVPFKRYGTATGFDPKTRQIINFAGFTTSGRFDDTWAFSVDGQTWHNKSNSIFPLKRCLTSQALVPARRQMLVYAGQSNGDLDDIWSLNLDTYQWENLSPSTKPDARHFPSIAYAKQDQLLMFGGYGGKVLDDTWKFDLNQRQWAKLELAEHPSARYGHVMVYLPQYDAVWLFGGANGGNRLNDTWQLRDLPTYLEYSHASVQEIRMVPNPVKDRLYFPDLVPASYRLTLSDLSGKEVFVSVLEGKEVMLPFDIKPGTYLLRLQNAERSWVKKMVKE